MDIPTSWFLSTFARYWLTWCRLVASVWFDRMKNSSSSTASTYFWIVSNFKFSVPCILPPAFASPRYIRLSRRSRKIPSSNSSGCVGLPGIGDLPEKVLLARLVIILGATSSSKWLITWSTKLGPSSIYSVEYLADVLCVDSVGEIRSISLDTPQAINWEIIHRKLLRPYFFLYFRTGMFWLYSYVSENRLDSHQIPYLNCPPNSEWGGVTESFLDGFSAQQLVSSIFKKLQTSRTVQDPNPLMVGLESRPCHPSLQGTLVQYDLQYQGLWGGMFGATW